MLTGNNKNRRRLVLTLVVLTAAVIAVVTAYFLNRDRNTGYITTPVTRGAIETTVLASGTVESDNLVSVGAQVSGQLKSLKVDLGDTVKAGQLFAKFDVPLSGYVVNRVLPEELKAQNIPEYLKNRFAMQEQYLKVIEETFKDQIHAYVPEMERDVTGLPMIEKLAKTMFDEF